MKNKYNFGLTTVLLLIFTSVILLNYDISKIYAVDLIDNNICQGVGSSDSPVCQTRGNTNPIYGKNGIIGKVTLFIAYIAGTVAVIVIILGGYKIVMSGGKSENVTKGREMIMYAAIGLVIIVIAQSIVWLVLSRI